MMMSASLHSRSSSHANRANASKDLMARSSHGKKPRDKTSSLSMSLHSGVSTNKNTTGRRGGLTKGGRRASSQRALLLSTKVKSIRGRMNPYQLGESSHTPEEEDEEEVDIGTDIDDSEVDVNVDDDESSFADDTEDVDYLLGGREQEEDDDEDHLSNASPNSVVIIDDNKPKSNSHRRGRNTRKSKDGRSSTRSPTDGFRKSTSTSTSTSSSKKKEHQGRRLQTRNSRRSLKALVVSDSGEDTDDSLSIPKLNQQAEEEASTEKKPKKKEAFLRKLTDDSSRKSQNSNPDKKPSTARHSLSKGSSHRKMIDAGSNHSARSSSSKLETESKSSHSRRTSQSSSGKNKDNHTTTPKEDNKSEDDESIGIRKGSASSRREAVSKQQSKYINQKPCRVGPIRRVASRGRARRASTQELPTAEGPMVGHGHSTFSGSVSSLSFSTGIASKDDFSLPSPGVFSQKKIIDSLGVSPHARRTAGLSRWNKGSDHASGSSPDAIPTPPHHDLSSLASPNPGSNPGIISRKLNLPTSSASAHQTPSIHCIMSQATPQSSISKLSGSSDFSNSMQSFALENIQEQIAVPQTPSQMVVGGDADGANTPAGMVSALTTPGFHNHTSQSSSSLQSKLKKLSLGSNPLSIETLEGSGSGSGYLGDVMNTPCSKTRKGLLQSKLESVPVTPSLSIGGPHGQELDTPGGVVSELTIGSSLMSDASNSSSFVSHRQRLSHWMTNVQSVMIHESDYKRDSIPKMVRRHSLDSVVSNQESNPSGQILPASSSLTKESDFAPKVPARQHSLASVMLLRN